MLRAASVFTLLAVVHSDMVCPPTAAWGPACGMKLTTTAAASCDVVVEEMRARVNGQYSQWHDPHNNGTYKIEQYGGSFSTSRLTGDGKYTDKQIFSLSSTSTSCKIEACSRSQVSSILDMGTNYCDLKMLFCGSADGCKPVKHDFTSGPEKTEKFSESSVNMGACLKVRESQTPHEMVELVKNHSVTKPEAGPCCNSCTAPEQKYFSVDVPHGFCGETCIDPSRFWLFKVFEKNLTKATDNTPCSEQFTPTGGHYSKYQSTVTHGVPGLLAVTLDLYAPVGA